MAPKKENKHSPGATKQQTLAAAFQKQRERQERAEKLNEGRVKILVVHQQHRVLEEKFVSTATTDVEQYKKGSQLSLPPSSNGTTAYAGARRSTRMYKRIRVSAMDKENDLEDLPMYKSTRWEEKGAAFIEVLAIHISPTTVLPLNHQELLLHMVLNADNHAAAVNLSSAALELLLVNARLHPLSRQDPKHPHIIQVNEHNMWKPENKFKHEASCYESVCIQGSSKLLFLRALLKGARQHVQQQLEPHQPVPCTADDPDPAGAAGPLGQCMALKYLTHILLEDFEVRMKVFREFGPHMVAPQGSLQGDLTAGAILSNSALAQLITADCNISTPEWLLLWTQIVRLLVTLILKTVPPETIKANSAGATPSKRGKAQSMERNLKASNSSLDAANLRPLAAAVSVGEVGAMARRLLRCAYDLFLTLEQERQVLNKEAKDIDCRMLALMLHKMMTKKDDCVDLRLLKQDPRAKAVLLSALSPRACLHLLGVTYALDTSTRWTTQTREVSIPPELVWLQPLRDYAEGNTSVRLICDQGPAKVDPIALLRELDADHLDQFRLSLMSQGAGEGFLTWLTALVSAVVLGMQQGQVDTDLAQLADAFEKVLVRLEPLVEQSSSNTDQALKLHNRIALAKAKRLLSSSTHGNA